MTTPLRWRLTRAALFALLFSLVAADVAEAQGIFRRARNAAARAAEREVERRTERAIENAVRAAFDAGEDAIECLFTDPECIESAQAEGNDVVLVDDDGRYVDPNGDPVREDNASDAVVRAARPPAASARPGEGAWANYDFVPGERPLYFDDFENDYVGNVPSRIDFKNGVMEVVEENGNQMLRFADASAFTIPLPETLPERFTIEFDVYSGDDWNSVVLGTGALETPNDVGCFHGGIKGGGYQGAWFKVGSFFETGVDGGDGGSSSTNQSAHEEAMVPIRIAVDGSYVKMYVGESRVSNVPNADVRRADYVTVTTCGELAAIDDGSNGPVLMDNLRIAAGGRQILHEALLADGRVATHGILFDTGSATIKPESTPTLRDLHRTLERHGDLRLRIEGHTDNTGSAETNLRLSQQRAEAVVAWLTGEGIDASRLEAEGMGQTQPAADNSTAEGRQQNRRVELVRL